MLTHQEARRLYDGVGAKQDTQAFYEARATEEIIPHLELATAQRIFEFGCGTGRFAAHLLTHHLPATATYRAVDLSPTMVGLARTRLAGFAPRVEVRLTDGGLSLVDERSACYDRFLSNFVLDLLSPDESQTVISEAHRILRSGAFVGLCSGTFGFTPATRCVAWAWSRIHSCQPKLVGGCRPIELLDLLPDSKWTIRHHARISSFTIPLEAVVAERM